MPVLTINPLYDHQFVHGNLEIWQDSVNSSNSKAVLDFHSVPRNDGEEVNYDARLIAQHDTGQLQIQFDANLTGGVLIQKGGLTINAGGATITGNSTVTGNLTIASGKLITPNNTLNTMGDDVEIGDGNVGGCLVVHGLNAASGISFKPYSGSTSQAITVNGSGTMTITNGSLLVNGGSILASAGSIHAGTNGNTAAERQVEVASGAGRLYMYSQAATTAGRGLYCFNHAGSASSLLSVGQDNNLVLQSANRAGTYGRNIRIENSGGTALSSNYILVRRG